MKRYCLTLKNDKKFLSKEFTDSISDTAFCDGDVVVVCKKCNAIMHESCWIKNGNLCGLCEGTELKDINFKFIQSYNPNEKKDNKNIITDSINDSNIEVASSKSNSKKKSKHKIIVLFLLVLVILCLVYGFTNYFSKKVVKEFNENETNNMCDVKDLENTTLSPIKELRIPQKSSKEISIDDAFVGEDIYIEEENSISFSGYSSESDSINEYYFTTPRDGVYTFSIEDIMASASVRLEVYDDKDECIISTSNNLAYEELLGNTKYKIIVTNREGESNFNLLIGIQKKTVDISNSSTIYDQVSFENQINKYIFSPSLNGLYRFDITQANANVQFRLLITDEKENNLESTHNNGVDVMLESGKTYEIQIIQSNGVGDYCLKIGFQKPTTDVTGYTVIKDSTQYINQENIYTLSPDVSGRYRLDITENNANNQYRISVWDALDNSILETSNLGGYMDLKKGEIYKIQIKQRDGFGNYTLNIGYQLETQNITDMDKIYDSIIFQDQINTYKIVANESRVYTFTLEDYNSEDCTIKLLVTDEYENELAYTSSGQATVDFISGNEYTVKIIQKTGISSYTLNVN